jgi:predicted RNase H-like HicB family nuclease
MNIKAIVHEEDGGGYWAEVPAIPGCATQGETIDELLANLREAIEGCLSVDVEAPFRDARNAYWKSPFESRVRPGVCSDRGAARLEASQNPP